jgi:tetratricopeptide (TPR) repeat protein
MGAQRRSLQDRIRERQQSGFVGRQGQVTQYQENFGFAVDDERRRFLFNIHGDAGVGKTFLSKQLRQVATGAGALTAYIDEAAEDVTVAMTIMAEEFSRAGSKLSDFEKRAAEYRQRRRELESDPHAPAGVAAFLTKTAVTIGLAAARDIPVAGSLLAPVDAAAAADQANQAREYLARRFSDHRDVRLLLSPADELTPVFVTGLTRAAAGRTVALFFDTYERTGLILDKWLRSLYAGRYGDLPETLITTISGQKPLDPNLWGEYLSVIADIPLEPFSEAEARQFLASKGITDETTIQVILTLSGRLPLWLATLADARLQGTADIGDPSGNAVERFLKWEDDPTRRKIAMAAALPRVLNQDVLAVITAPDEARELFSWLRGLPFVSQRGESWAYHNVVRAAMLRLRRAEAPVEWRSKQNLLAQANAHWASEADERTDSAWANADWVDYTREETYHMLCADPHGNLPKALASAVKAAENSPVRARQWAALITDAGRDANNDRLREWGQRLTECLHGDDLGPYLTCLINDAVLDDTNLVVAHERRGQTYSAIGRYEDALADFNRAIELDPGRAWAIAERAQTYRLMERYDDALADLNRAIELDPGRAWAVLQRAQTYRLMERYDDALADLNRAIELDPRYALAIAGRAETYWSMERYDDALADFNRAIELNPRYVWAIAGRGQTYRSMERYDDALADLSRAIELSPRYAWAIAGRGETYRAMERYDDALADFNRSIELDPDQAWAIACRGETYRAMERYDDALADFNRAIELDPTDNDYASKRAEIQRLMSKSEDALSREIYECDLDFVLAFGAT